ncbi:MAG: exodeoxyribonuclease III, partial [Candidatus Absconditabacterales bacterium]
NRIRHAGEKPGYSGVATFYKKSLPLISGTSKFDSVEHFHEEGRVVETKFQTFTLLNLYFPNGGERADGREMLSYKLEFYKHFLHYINKLRDAGEKVIACGDFNICHEEIDIARPKENEHNIGFLLIERAEMDKLQKNGYVDVFRHFYPDKRDQYTWRSYRANARHNNVGRRLDYFRVSENVISDVKKITHETAIEGSDHCPIVLELRT